MPPADPVDLARIINAVNGRLEDAFFAYNRFDLDANAIAALRQNAEILKPVLSDFQDLRVLIEGHCDERGSAEFNLALGDRRASRAAEALHDFGVRSDRTEIISYGKEAPQCLEATELCWSRNRRAHIVLRKPGER